MIKINNLFTNPNIQLINELGCVKVFEYQRDLSVSPQTAQTAYFSSAMNVRRRQVLVEVSGNTFVLQAGAMQWMAGNVRMTSGIKGVGDFVGKTLGASVTKETASKPEYSGNGLIMLEPTYKFILLEQLDNWGSMVLEDGLFLGCDGTINRKIITRKNVSSAVLGGEGLFNLCLEGKGVAVLESPVPKEELLDVYLENDELKVDGHFAIAWSNSLSFTVEKAANSLMGSAISKEGFVNVYRGTGRILMAPVL